MAESGLTEDQQEIAALLYQQMVTAHLERWGKISVRGRQYLDGLAKKLTVRMGFSRSLGAQAEDSPDSYQSIPVEDAWNRERRDRTHSQRGNPAPIRRWREVQLIRSALLPTEKDWR